MSDFGEQFLIDVEFDVDNRDSRTPSIRDPSGWKRSVLLQLMKIARSDTGLILLRAIRWHGHRCLIAPPNPNADPCNSGAISIDPWDGDPTAAGLRRTYLVKVEFDPNRYAFASPCFRLKHGETFKYGRLPDEVLFHELTHAFRKVSGADNKGKQLLGGATATYGTTEEFLAIVLTNIYISDITNPHSSGLRGGHLRHDALDTRVATSLSFFKSNPQVLPILSEFMDSARGLCDALCNVKAVFNPIRALKDPTLARLIARLSDSGEARLRNLVAPGAQLMANLMLPNMDVDPMTQRFVNELAGAALTALGR